MSVCGNVPPQTDLQTTPSLEVPASCRVLFPREAWGSSWFLSGCPCSAQLPCPQLPSAGGHRAHSRVRHLLCPLGKPRPVPPEGGRLDPLPRESPPASSAKSLPEPRGRSPPSGDELFQSHLGARPGSQRGRKAPGPGKPQLIADWEGSSPSGAILRSGEASLTLVG